MPRSRGGPELVPRKPRLRTSSYGARVLIEGLVALGKQQSWRRIYWHAHENNYRARALYDQLSRRTDYVRYVERSPLPGTKQNNT